MEVDALLGRDRRSGGGFTDLGNPSRPNGFQAKEGQGIRLGWHRLHTSTRQNAKRFFHHEVHDGAHVCLRHSAGKKRYSNLRVPSCPLSRGSLPRDCGEIFSLPARMGQVVPGYIAANCRLFWLPGLFVKGPGTG